MNKLPFPLCHNIGLGIISDSFSIFNANIQIITKGTTISQSFINQNRTKNDPFSQCSSCLSACGEIIAQTEL